MKRWATTCQKIPSALDDRTFVIILLELSNRRDQTPKECRFNEEKPAESQARFERSMGDVKTPIKTKERRQRNE
jgi:hypothetical protein